MVELLTRKVYRKTLASIVASIQPKMKYPALLEMVTLGVTIFRINFSWFHKAPKAQWVRILRDIERIAIQENLVLGIMLDTKGPEFRVRVRDAGAIPLDKDPQGLIYEPRKKGYIYRAGKRIILTLDPDKKTTARQIAVQAPPKTIFKELGKRVVFCDGDYEARIEPANRHDDSTLVIVPNWPMCVWDGAKMNFPQTSITASTLSEEDQEIIKFFLEKGKDLDQRVNFMFAQSFIKNVNDLIVFRGFLVNTMLLDDPIIIAKLETYESSLDENLAQIVEQTSAVMIARGDLANETSREGLPQLQRKIIKVAKQFNKPILLATHVYGSMQEGRRFNCARPEAEDVRSALELGVDGFVLTGETTNRPDDPQTVVRALVSQIKKDEDDLITKDKNDPAGKNHYEELREVERIAFHKKMWEQMRDPELSIPEQRKLGTTDFAIAAVFRANQYGALGIFPFTVNGRTVREMGRFYPETEIYPITNSAEIAQTLLLCRCTHPVLVKLSRKDLKDISIESFKNLVRKIVNELGLRKRNENARYAICTIPHPPSRPGGTDTLLRIRIDGKEDYME